MYKHNFFDLYPTRILDCMKSKYYAEQFHENIKSHKLIRADDLFFTADFKTVILTMKQNIVVWFYVFNIIYTLNHIKIKSVILESDLDNIFNFQKVAVAWWNNFFISDLIDLTMY